MNKKKYAKLDENNNIEFEMFTSNTQAAEKGFLPYEEQEKPKTPANVIPHNYCRKYVEEKGKVVMYWEAYPNYEAIKRLKQLLASSDYKVIKCYEASLVKRDIPYDMVSLYKERQEIRDEINRLEECR